MVGPAAQTRDVITFGRFALVPGERLLTEDGVSVDLGARTLDTLIALLSRPNEVVGKRELMAQVWPDVTVDEPSLRFHIASLRRALGDGMDGARYIATVAGRGYCFVAPVARVGGRVGASMANAADVPRATFLPARLARMVGREDTVHQVSAQLTASRFVTIVGAGGVGKTTVAVAVAHDLLTDFDGAVLFVDFGMLSNPAMVPASLAAMLGISIRSDNPLPDLIAHVRDKRMLVILDNCEHVIEAAANMAEQIFLAAPRLHILATSREALRVEGERVHRLVPLGVPPDDPDLTAAVALSFPATQLFIERAAASGTPLDVDDADAAIVANICRQLDGVALAIELAAGRVEAYGLRQTATLLDQRLNMQWPGLRTAPPRQKTLQATLDWSYGLLSELEREVFRRLAVFVGHFTLEAALAVVSSATVDQAHVFGAIDSLVAKSMVAARPVGAMMRYRLLDTARAYALDIGADDAERAGLAARHATYCRRRMEQTGADWPTLSDVSERAPHLVGLGDVRAALEWCFESDGDAEIGVGLAAAAAPIFLALSLPTECQRWSERAILALDDATRGSREEMHLQAALGMSLMFTRGSSEAVREALDKSLAIAEEHDDARAQLRLLSTLNMFHCRIGDLGTAFLYAGRCAGVAKTIAEPAAFALAHALMGLALQTRESGDARAELEAALRYGPGSRAIATTYLGFDGYTIAGVALARTLWLQGHSAEAKERARQAVKDATSVGHPIALSISLIWAVSVFLWAGDLDTAEEHTDWFIARAESYSLGPYRAVGRGFKAILAIRRGDAGLGVDSLPGCLMELRVARYEQVTTLFAVSLVQGLAVIGRPGESLAKVDETIRRVEVRGDLYYMPELLRVKGGLLLAMSRPGSDDAETCLVQSLDWSRRQGAHAWSLRAAVDLAALRADQGRPAEARTLLQPVVEQFVGDRDTADMKAAKCLLATLGG